MSEAVNQLKSTFQAFSQDKAPRLASSIAYATIFALAPLLIVLIAILGFIIGTQNGGHGHHVAENALLNQISAHAGPQAASTVRDMVTAQFNKPRQSVIAQIIGWVAFVLAASGLFGALQDALNTVWNVEATKGGWKQMLRERFASFGMVAVLGFILVISFGANAALTFLSTRFFSTIPVVGSPVVLAIVNDILSVVIIAVVFASVYKVLPDVSIGWKDVWVGAIATAVLFVVGEALISLYITKAGIASAYGAAGSVLVALLWIYYSAMILLLGAEFTKVHSRGAKTEAPSILKGTVEVPAGVDPRKSGGVTTQGRRSP